MKSYAHFDSEQLFVMHMFVSCADETHNKSRDTAQANMILAHLYVSK